MHDHKNKSKLIDLLKGKSLSLTSRLFLSHLLVMSVAISILVIVGKTASPIFFSQHIERIEEKGFYFRDVRSEVIEGFGNAWHNSTLLSVIVGSTAAGGLSFFVSRLITKPLVKIEKVTQEFAKGRLSERLPPARSPK